MAEFHIRDVEGMRQVCIEIRDETVRAAARRAAQMRQRVEEALEAYGPSEITRDDILELDDPAYESGNVALVTGAASGIGAGIAGELAATGHHVVVTDLDGHAAGRQAARITGNGGSAEACVLDVTEDTSVSDALASLSRPVDVLVNNAGLQHVSRLEDFPVDKWDQLVQVMLTGTARLTRACLPGMRQRGFGRVVNIGSIHSLVASAYKSAYVAAKHGLMGFSKVIALETADADITINTICPTYVKTPLVDRQIADQAKAHGIPEEQVINEIMLKPMPKGVFITFAELAGITEFLIGPAARNITGQAIVVDGGWTVQ